MNQSKNLFAVSVLTAGLLFLNSCKKEPIETSLKTKQDQTAASAKVSAAAIKNFESYSATQTIMFGIVDYGSKHFKTEGGGLLDGFACATVTKDTISVPHVASVDFGAGCYNAAGKFFSGQVSVEYLESDFKAPGNYYRATFTNFVAGDRQVSGTMQLTYTGFQLSGNESMSVEADLETNFFKDHLQFTGRNHINLEYSPDSVGDDQALGYFTGDGSGITSDSIAFTQTITTPILMRASCAGTFIEGILHIESPSLPDKDIDYGNGSCDVVVTVHENGTSYDTTIK